MLIRIFGLLEALQPDLKHFVKEASDEIGLDWSSNTLIFSSVPIRPPWLRGPIRILPCGEDISRRERKFVTLVEDKCDAYYALRGGYLYAYWHGVENPILANQEA